MFFYKSAWSGFLNLISCILATIVEVSLNFSGLLNNEVGTLNNLQLYNRANYPVFGPSNCVGIL